MHCIAQPQHMMKEQPELVADGNINHTLKLEYYIGLHYVATCLTNIVQWLNKGEMTPVQIFIQNHDKMPL